MIAFIVSLCSVIGPENTNLSLNQSDAKMKPISTWSPMFSLKVVCLLHFEFSMAPEVIFLLLIGCYNYFGYSFTTEYTQSNYLAN